MIALAFLLGSDYCGDGMQGIGPARAQAILQSVTGRVLPGLRDVMMPRADDEHDDHDNEEEEVGGGGAGPGGGDAPSSTSSSSSFARSIPKAKYASLLPPCENTIYLGNTLTPSSLPIFILNLMKNSSIASCTHHHALPLPPHHHPITLLCLLPHIYACVLPPILSCVSSLSAIWIGLSHIRKQKCCPCSPHLHYSVDWRSN